MAHIRRKTLKTTTRVDGSLKRPRYAYQVRWIPIAGGNERSRQFSTYEHARQFKTQIENDLQTGTYIDPALARMSFHDYATTNLASRHNRERSRQRMESMLRVHVFPYIGKAPIGTIHRSDVQGVINQAVKTLASSTTRTLTGHIISIFNDAVRDHIIKVSPCSDLKYPEVITSQIIIPTTEEIYWIANSVPEQYRAAVWLAAGTGLRSGELRGLVYTSTAQVDGGIDFLHQMVRVRFQAERQPLKTAASRRDVPAAPVVLAKMASHLERFPPTLGKSLWPQNRSTFSHAIRSTLRDIGFAKGTGWHILRHFYASMLIRSGLDIKIIQVRMGHASITETMDTYGHLWPDNEDRSRDAVEAILGPHGEVREKSV